MEDPKPDRPLSLMGELRRRKVLYTAVVYGISAFAVTEIAAFLFENFGVPEWADRLLAALFVAGFPVAMFLSWAFDIGPDGVVRASSGDRRRRWTTIALALALLVVATGGLFYLIFPEPEAPTMASAPSKVNDGPSADYGFEQAEKLENSIAVLPFENLSADPDDAFFSRGVAEEVLNHLATYRELNIIGRTSSFVFENSEVPAPKISALLGVRYLLQGSVRRHDKQVRISTQLLDEHGVQLWSQNFDRRLIDIFAIQTEIAVAVAEAVVPEITARTPEILATSLDAYDHYLKGRDLVYGRRQDEAADELKRAIELDPDFAPAYAELAIALALSGKVESAGEAAEVALSLRPGLLRALAAQGLILLQQTPPDGPASEAVLRRVLAQDPNMIDAIMWLAQSLRAQGLEDEADELMAGALRMDPLHPTLSRNEANRAAERGEDQRAIAIARRVIASPENQSFHPYVALFDLYTARGKLIDAARVAREFTESSARSDVLAGYCYCMLIWAHSLLGDRALADYWLERSYADFPGSWWTDYFKVLSLRWQGRYGDALRAANELYHQQPGMEDELPDPASMTVGVIEVLAGNFSSAVERLAGLRDTPQMYPQGEGLDALQALAWAYLKTGQGERAGPLLAEIEDEFEKLERKGTLLFTMRETPHGYALNAALRGDDEQALDRLEAIIEAGWRAYYLHQADPRWGALRDDPRFQALMQRVKADVDRQRAELESTESHQTFVTRLGAAISAKGGRTD